MRANATDRNTLDDGAALRPTEGPWGPFEPVASDDLRAEPYGLLGLLVSLVAILALTIVVILVVAAAGFGGAVLALGTTETLARVSDLLTPDTLDKETTKRLLIAGTLLQDGALCLSIVALAAYRGRRRWRDLIAAHAWSLRRSFWPLVGLLVLAMVYNVAASGFVEKIHPQAKNWAPVPTGAGWLALFAVLAVVVAPLSEELLFRGWIYTSLRRSFGVAVALVVSSALFATAHWESSHLYALTIFPIGLVLGFIRERNGSIGASMLFHAAFNGLATIVLFTAGGS